MDEEQFKQRVSKLMEIGNAIEKLPSEIRAAAFSLLSPYITQAGSTAAPFAGTGSQAQGDASGEGREEFFNAHDHSKPSDNVRLIAAYFYREYGTAAFSIEEISRLSNEVGIIVPNRIDNTLKSAKEKGKSLFVPSGKGSFKPTVSGEAWIKEHYKIKKGNQQKPAE